MSTCDHDRQDDVCWVCKDERIADLERQVAEAVACRDLTNSALGVVRVQLAEALTQLSQREE